MKKQNKLVMVERGSALLNTLLKQKAWNHVNFSSVAMIMDIFGLFTHNFDLNYVKEYNQLKLNAFVNIL